MLQETTINRIHQLCDEREITYNRLCTISGVTQSTLQNVINKRNKSVTIVTIKKLCDGFGITLADFFNTPEFNSLEQEIE